MSKALAGIAALLPLLRRLRSLEAIGEAAAAERRSIPRAGTLIEDCLVAVFWDSGDLSGLPRVGSRCLSEAESWNRGAEVEKGELYPRRCAVSSMQGFKEFAFTLLGMLGMSTNRIMRSTPSQQLQG